MASKLTHLLIGYLLSSVIIFLEWQRVSADETTDYILKNNHFSLENDVKKYIKYGELQRLLQYYNARYPSITRLKSIGKSVQGRELWYMQITDNPDIIELGEPMFKYVGNIHGNEVLSRQVLIYLIQYLCENYGTDPRVTKIINNTNIFIMPTVNPDGFEYAREGDCDGTMTDVDRYHGGHNNAHDKDLNENFPDQFTTWYTYNLKEAEPETRAMMRWSYRTPFVLSGSLHTGNIVASYPFESNSESKDGIYSQAPDDPFFKHLALTYSQAHPLMKSGKPNCTGDSKEEYKNGITNGAKWHNMPGNMEDFNYLLTNCFEIEIHIACCKYPLLDDAGKLLDKEWQYNKEALLKYIEQVQRGIKGIILDQGGKAIVKAVISIDGLKHTVKSISNGNYWRLILPGVYTISATAPGYDRVSKDNIHVLETQPTVVNFVLRSLESKPTIRASRESLGSIPSSQFVDTTTSLIDIPSTIQTSGLQTPNFVPSNGNDNNLMVQKSSIPIKFNQPSKTLIPLTTDKIKELFSKTINPVHINHHNYLKMTQFLVNIKKRYKSIVQLYSIGKSTEARELWVVEVSNNPGMHTPGKPEFKYVANMHGNEVVGRECTLLMLEYLCENYATSLEVQSIVNNSRIHFMPSMNPDGYEKSHEGDRQGTTGRHNGNDVDLNRNFPDQFDKPGVIHKMQPETIAVMRWIAQGSFVLSVNLHGGALVANYPFDDSPSGKDNYTPSPDDAIFRHLATVYANAHPMMHFGNGCPEEPKETFDNGITNGAEWYSVKGGLQDFNYLHSNDFEITVEMGCFKFPPQDRLKPYWDGHKIPLLRLAMEIFKGVKGFVRTPEGLPIKNATISVSGINHNIRSLKDGDYFRLLMPGNYVITVSAVGFHIVAKPVVITSSLAIELNFTLTPLNDFKKSTSKPNPNTPVVVNVNNSTKEELSNFMENLTAKSSTSKVVKSTPSPATTTAKSSEFVYHNYDSMLKFLQDHKQKFPDIVMLQSLGESPTSKRSILSVTITAPSEKAEDDENKANIALIGGEHTYDTIGREMLLMYLHLLAKQYKESNPKIVELLKNTRIHIVPMIMVDDMEKTVAGDCDGSKFAGVKEEIYNKFSDDSESWEVKSLTKWLEEKMFLFTAVLQGGETFVSYPPNSVNDEQKFDDSILKSLASSYALKNSKIASGKGCNAVERTNGIASGVSWKSQDNTMAQYALLKFNTPQINVHFLCCVNPPVEDVPAIWKENKDALLVFAQQALSRVYGKVSDASNAPVKNSVISFGELNSGPVFIKSGFYQKYLPAKTYMLVAKSDGFQPVETDITITLDKPVRKDFVFEKQKKITVTAEAKKPDIAHHHVYRDYAQELTAIAQEYPGIMRLYDIGTSVQGRKILVLEISDNPGVHEAGEPEVKLVAGLHGNELIGRRLLVSLARHLVQGYGTSGMITSLLNRTRIHLLPLANPDGAQLANDQSCTSEVGKNNANNVDLIQDFPANNYDNKPTQPETRAIVEWINKVPFVLSATLHGGSLVVSYPFSKPNTEANPNPTQDDDVFKYLAKGYAQEHAEMRHGEPFCPGPDVNEQFDGGVVNMAEWAGHEHAMIDYNYKHGRGHEVAIYSGCCKAPNTAQSENLWKSHRKSLLKFLAMTHTGVKGYVYDGSSSKKIPGVKIRVQGRDYTTQTAEFGDFWRLLLPGTYRLTATVPGYEPKVITVKVANPKRVSVVNFAMDPLGTHASSSTNMHLSTVVFVALTSSCAFVFLLLIYIVIRVYRARAGGHLSSRSSRALGGGFKPLRDHLDRNYLQDVRANAKKKSHLVMESEVSDFDEEEEEEVIFSEDELFKT